MTLLVGYIVLPNFDRKELRRNVPKVRRHNSITHHDWAVCLAAPSLCLPHPPFCLPHPPSACPSPRARTRSSSLPPSPSPPRHSPQLLHDVGVFYDTAAHYYVDPQLKTFPIEPILTLQAAVQKQTGRIPQTVWEWWPLQESKRHVRNQVKAWQTLGKSLTHSVIVIHAIRLHFVESDWTPPCEARDRSPRL